MLRLTARALGAALLACLAAAAFAQEQVPRLSASQYNHIYGWPEGDPRYVDTVGELTPDAFSAFWDMSAADRQSVFDRFSWPVVESLATQEMRMVLAAPDPKKRSLQNKVRGQYEDLIDLLAQRFKLNIAATDLYGGMMYLIDGSTLLGNQHNIVVYCLLDNINMLKPKGFLMDTRIELRQRIITIRSSGAVVVDDLFATPLLTPQQRLARDYLFR